MNMKSIWLLIVLLSMEVAALKTEVEDEEIRKEALKAVKEYAAVGVKIEVEDEVAHIAAERAERKYYLEKAAALKGKILRKYEAELDKGIKANRELHKKATALHGALLALATKLDNTLRLTKYGYKGLLQAKDFLFLDDALLAKHKDNEGENLAAVLKKAEALAFEADKRKTAAKYALWAAADAYAKEDGARDAKDAAYKELEAADSAYAEKAQEEFAGRAALRAALKRKELSAKLEEAAKEAKRRARAAAAPELFYYADRLNAYTEAYGAHAFGYYREKGAGGLKDVLALLGAEYCRKYYKLYKEVWDKLEDYDADAKAWNDKYKWAVNWYDWLVSLILEEHLKAEYHLRLKEELAEKEREEKKWDDDNYMTWAELYYYAKLAEWALKKDEDFEKGLDMEKWKVKIMHENWDKWHKSIREAVLENYDDKDLEAWEEYEEEELESAKS